MTGHPKDGAGDGLIVVTKTESFWMEKFGAHSVPVNEPLQAVVDDPPRCMDELAPLLDSIEFEENEDLVKWAERTYKSYLMYYRTCLPVKTTNEKQNLVIFLNRFSEQIGLVEPPEMEWRMIQKRKLVKFKLLNIG
jgi:hypothetical protein